MSDQQLHSADASSVADRAREARIGVGFAVAAYVTWGFMPLYWKTLAHVSPLEVLFQRIVWAVPMLFVWLLVRRRLMSALVVFREPKTLMMVVIAAGLMSYNWWVFVYAVGHGLIIAASFGYFINPLIAVLLGVCLLGERLSNGQAFAVGLAFIAICVQTGNIGALPWVSLSLAGTFSIYGYIKKKTPHIGAAQGLFIEVLLMSPFALAGMYWLGTTGVNSFHLDDNYSAVFLVLAGFATILPLVLFSAGARRIRLTTLGILQYIGPSLNLMIAIYVYNEPVDPIQLFSFALIWLALVVFSIDAIMAERARTEKR